MPRHCRVSSATTPRRELPSTETTPPAYQGIPFDHETVRHSTSEYVRGEVHTNGIESHCSMMKRAHTGTFQKISPKHLDRYVQEFAGRHNMRDSDAIDIMGAIADGGVGKRLQYEDLIADNDSDSGARS
ncbi:MAG: transposase [Rhodospirillaceae bacterium]|nr:transposase [Rhodospirillaceae bacterium]